MKEEGVNHIQYLEDHQKFIEIVLGFWENRE